MSWYMMRTRGGVYRFTCMPTGRHYIGGTAHPLKRWSEHLAQAKRGKHPNADIQADYDRHGPDAFEFCMLEIVEDEAARQEREQVWLERYRAELGEGLVCNRMNASRGEERSHVVPSGRKRGRPARSRADPASA
jgi:group I intron endonuclease